MKRSTELDGYLHFKGTAKSINPLTSAVISMTADWADISCLVGQYFYELDIFIYDEFHYTCLYLHE